MVEVRVDDEGVLRGAPVLQPRPGRDALQRGVPALAGRIGRRRQPESARAEQGEAIGAIAEHRKYAGLLALVAADADAGVGGLVGLDLPLLVTQQRTSEVTGQSVSDRGDLRERAVHPVKKLITVIA